MYVNKRGKGVPLHAGIKNRELGLTLSGLSAFPVSRDKKFMVMAILSSPVSSLRAGIKSRG